MIQRLQTVFLLLTLFAFGAMFALPWASTETAREQFLEDKVYNVFDSTILLGVVIIGMLLSLIAIFLYKNRSTQSKVTAALIVLCIALPILAAALFYPQYQRLNHGVLDEELGLLLFPLGLIFAVLAFRFIRRDQKLVRSMDRLR